MMLPICGDLRIGSFLTGTVLEWLGRFDIGPG